MIFKDGVRTESKIYVLDLVLSLVYLAANNLKRLRSKDLLVIDISQTTRHASSEVPARQPQDDSPPSRHVLTPVISATLKAS